MGRGYMMCLSRDLQVTKKFTQRVRLPHFSDERAAKYFFEPGGLLTVEVPLIYYFPRKDRKTNVKYVSLSSGLCLVITA